MQGTSSSSHPRHPTYTIPRSKTIIMRQTTKKLSLLLAPIQLHLVALTLLVICVSIVRLDLVAQVLESLLGVGVVNMIKNEAIFVNGDFQLLGILTWLAHVLPVTFSIEFAYSFYLLKKKHPDEAAREKYSRLFIVFSIEVVQTFFAVISHSQIAYNTKLELAFFWWHQRLITNNIFGTGLAVTFGPWTLIPCLLAVVHGYIGFNNWAGRILATYTQVIYFGPEFPKMFPCSMLLLPVLAVTQPFGEITETDTAHLFATVVLDMILGLMLFAIRGKVLEVADKKNV
jgi:hypothetical protein